MTPLLLKKVAWLVCLISIPPWAPVLAGEEAPKVPTRVLQPRDSENFLSFENDLHPGNRIGYRLHEHLPLVAGQVPTSSSEAGLDSVEIEKTIETFRSRSGVYIHTRKVVEEGWAPQTWTFYLAPIETGFEVIWVVETQDVGLERYYSAQQCFRMTGKTNEDWRRTIAETPDFSEYDFWTALETGGKGKESLSWVRRNKDWSPIPAIEKRLVSPTPDGKALEEAGGLNSRQVLEILDPKHAGEIAESVDGGLLVRTNPERTWVCGLYWERTTHVSNHHPADCLHAIVNLGPVPPHSMRAIRGRIYWMQGSKEELYDLWRKEFSD